MNDNINTKYLLVLAAIAVVVLCLGVFLRPKDTGSNSQAPSETTVLPSLARREDLRATATYFAQRASVLAQYVVFLPQQESSGVIWDAGKVLTTSKGPSGTASQPLFTMQEKTGAPPPSQPSEPIPGRWILIVGRSSENEPYWIPAVYGGRRAAQCEDVDYPELIVNAPLDAKLAGAGVFDLDGALLGIAAKCGASYHLVASEGIPALLRAFDSLPRRLSAHYSFRVSALSEESRQALGSDSGLLVTEILQTGLADRAGLNAGDLIVGVDGQTVGSEPEFWKSLETGEHNLGLLRGRKRLTVGLAETGSADTVATASSRGLTLTAVPRQTEYLSVDPNTAAYRAGLRTGDLLLQAGEKQNPAGSDLRRLFAANPDRPILVVFQRDSTQRAIVLSK